eukprot:jgi/Chrzof1/12823/Cz07g08230.t1
MAAYTVLALQVLQTLLPPAWHYQHTNTHQSGERRQGFQPCRIQHMQAVASGITNLLMPAVSNSKLRGSNEPFLSNRKAGASAGAGWAAT